jgi:DnaJ-like protein
MSADRDDRRRACAVLGLPRDAGPEEIRRRYKALVRRWHPDRHMADPRGATEAAARLREINAAYARLRRLEVPPVSTPSAPEVSWHPPAAPGRRLTREEIDRMVQSIGTEGFFEIAFGDVAWFGRLFDRVWMVFYLMAAGIVLLRVLIFRDLFWVRESPETAVLVLLLIGFGIASWVQHHFGSKPSPAADRSPGTYP